MNVFIFYIIKFNQVQNSYFIKKLQNLRNSTKYEKEENYTIINNAFSVAISNTNIHDFLDNNLIKLTKHSTYGRVVLLLGSLLSKYNEDNHKGDGLKQIFEVIDRLIPKTSSAEVSDEYATVDSLNNIIFSYISNRFKEILSLFNKKKTPNSDYRLLSYYNFDIKLLGTFYFSIICLCHNFNRLYNKNIKDAFDNADTYSKIFDKYSDSSVISYIKIRDGQNETKPQYQLFNPRYIYFTDITGENEDDKSLGVVKESDSPTLSLLYCNNPGGEILIPPSRNYIETLETIDENEEILESFILDKIDEPDEPDEPDDALQAEKKKYKPIKYDHLLHYGHFNKILYNVDNQTFGINMQEIRENLTNKKDVFVIGYGASGAGKTTTLIYDKTAIKKGNKDKADGAIVFTLNQLAENSDQFKQLTLTITELFMDDPKDGEPITPKAFDKIKDIEFNYADAGGIYAFQSSFNYDSYKRSY